MRCDWFVIVLSQNAVASMWVKRELTFVLNEPRYQSSIVPVLLEPCEHRKVFWTLGAYQIVDFTQNYDDGYRDLLRVWGLGHRP